MKYTLSTRDFLKGLIIAVGTSVLVIIENTVTAGSLTFDWKVIAMAAIGSGVAYLLKNWATDDVKSAKSVLKDAATDHVEAAKVDNIETKK